MNYLKEFLRGRLLGHPVHIMLVHFPIALFPMGVFFNGLSLYFKDTTLSLFAFYLISAGAAAGWTALVFGTIDLLKISPQNKAFNTALLHGGLNFLWLTTFTIFAGLGLNVYPDINLPSMGRVAAEITAAAGMLYSNYLGGVLLLRYDIGKEKSESTD